MKENSIKAWFAVIVGSATIAFGGFQVYSYMTDQRGLFSGLEAHSETQIAKLRANVKELVKSVDTFADDEKRRDDIWMVTETAEHKTQENVVRDVLKELSTNRAKLEANNELMKAILSAVNEQSYHMGVYQGHHDNHILDGLPDTGTHP